MKKPGEYPGQITFMRNSGIENHRRDEQNR